MKKLLHLIVVAIIILNSSCETDHTNKKVFLNLSSYTLQVNYLNRHYLEELKDVIHPKDSVVIDYRWDFGCYKTEENLPPCVVQEEDSIKIYVPADSTLVFTGNLRDETRWYSDFYAGNSSNQVCTFIFVNEDFEH